MTTENNFCSAVSIMASSLGVGCGEEGAGRRREGRGRARANLGGVALDIAEEGFEPGGRGGNILPGARLLSRTLWVPHLQPVFTLEHGISVPIGGPLYTTRSPFPIAGK